MSHAPRTTPDASSRPDRPRRRSASRAAGAPTPRPESAANTQRSREARHADNRRDDNRRPSSPAPDAAPLVAIEPSGPAVTSFAKLGVPAALVSCLAAQGIDSAFPIQSATLPDSLAGRDVLGRGRTGSGKTIAFALPLVARLAADRPSRPPRPPARPRAAARPASSPRRCTRRIAPLADGDGPDAPRPSSAASARAVRSPRCATASTSSSPAPAASRTSSASATCASTTSRSPCSTRPTTWPTSASCPA